MVNISAFYTMSSLKFNSTNLTNTEELIPNMIATTDNISRGYFGLTAMIGIFILIFYISFKQDGDIRLDLTRSLLMSSGFASMFGVVMLVTGLSSSFVHLMWFLTIFIISLVSIYNLKKKGL